MEDSLHLEKQLPQLVLLTALFPIFTFQQRLYHLEQFTEFKGFAQANQGAFFSFTSVSVHS